MATVTINGSSTTEEQAAALRVALDAQRRPGSTDITYDGVWASRPGSPSSGDRAYFSDLGDGTIPWKYDGTQWRPCAPVRIVSRTGVASASASTDEQILWQTALPPGLFDLQTVLIRIGYGRSSTTNNGSFLAYISNSTDPSADFVEAAWTTPSATFATASRSIGVDVHLRLEETSVHKLGSGTAGATGTPGGSYCGDASTSGVDVQTSTSLDISGSNVYFQISSVMAGTSSVAQLGQTSVWILP